MVQVVKGCGEHTGGESRSVSRVVRGKGAESPAVWSGVPNASKDS